MSKSFDLPEFLSVRAPMGGTLSRGQHVAVTEKIARAVAVRVDKADLELFARVAALCDMERATYMRWCMQQMTVAIMKEYQAQMGKSLLEE